MPIEISYAKFLLQHYKELFEGSGTGPGEKTLEDKFFEQEVNFIQIKKKLVLYTRQIKWNQLSFTQGCDYKVAFKILKNVQIPKQ